jgi:magnesium-dependent phosphatase-1
MTKLIVFDLDETLWSLSDGYCALMCPPYRREGDRVFDASGLDLALRDDARDTLDALERRGYLLSVASRSTPQTAGEILKLLGLLDRFLCPCFAWQDKDASLSKVLADLEASRGIQLEPQDVLFVDDWPSNIQDAKKLGIPGLVFGRDIHSLSEILNHLNGSLDGDGDTNAIRSL